MRPIDGAILAKLIKNSRQSDRQIAKELGVSQPTISRRRGELEKEGFLDYIASTNLAKLGFEILAITFGNRASHPEHPELQLEKINDFIKGHPQLIFVSSGIGLGADRVVFSVHKNYGDYDNFKREFRQEWAGFMTVLDSFMISFLHDSIPEHFTLKSLAGIIEEDWQRSNTKK